MLKARRTKLTSNTEQDVVIAPSDFWRLKLKSKVDAAIQKKLPGTKYAPDEAYIVASVNDRSEDDLELAFEDCVIEWPDIEKRLLQWSALYLCQKEAENQIKIT